MWDEETNKKFCKRIREKIKTLEQTLEKYRGHEGEHLRHMETILKEEISTLKWVLNLNQELQG